MRRHTSGAAHLCECGCRACLTDLNLRFARLVCTNWDDEELANLRELTKLVEPPVTTNIRRNNAGVGVGRFHNRRPFSDWIGE